MDDFPEDVDGGMRPGADRKDAVTAAATAAGLDPGCFDWMWQSASTPMQGSKADGSYRLTDDEWSLLKTICPPETRANAWSWREFFDVELWLRRPRNRLNALENANAHRCRKRRAAGRGDFDLVLERIRGLDALAKPRKDELTSILLDCIREGQRIRAKYEEARRCDAPEVRSANEKVRVHRHFPLR